MTREDCKILLVDDFGTIRAVLKMELSRMGYKCVEEAEEGATALTMLKAAQDAGQPYSIVISDWNMPGMSGIELLEAVRSDQVLAAMPFIMVTAEADMNSVMRAIKSGATDYLVKPIAADALGKKMEKVLETIMKKTA